MSSQSPAAIHLQILLNKANERIKELEAEETRLTGLVSLYFNSIKSRNEYIAQLEAELASLRDTSRTLALLDAERIKELEAECVAAKDYMVKCGEQSSLDAKRIAELEAAARCAPVPLGFISDDAADDFRTGKIYYFPIVQKVPSPRWANPIYLDPQPPNQGE